MEKNIFSMIFCGVKSLLKMKTEIIIINFRVSLSYFGIFVRQ